MLRAVLEGGVAALVVLAYMSVMAGPLLDHRIKAVTFWAILPVMGAGTLDAVLRD